MERFCVFRGSTGLPWRFFSSGPYPTSDLLATSAATLKDLVTGGTFRLKGILATIPQKTTPTKKQGFNKGLLNTELP